MIIKIPDNFLDAKHVMTEFLDGCKSIGFKQYGSLSTIKVGSIEDTQIEVKDDDSSGTFNLFINYTAREIGEHDKFITSHKERNFTFLSTGGDVDWTKSMIDKVWDGEYPSSIAIEKSTGLVFLVYLRLNWLEFVEFGKLEPEVLEAIEYDLDDRKPYKLKLDEKAMFLFIDGSEGYNYLRKGVYIELQCGVPVTVHNNLWEEGNTFQL